MAQRLRRKPRWRKSTAQTTHSSGRTAQRKCSAQSVMELVQQWRDGATLSTRGCQLHSRVAYGRRSRMRLGSLPVNMTERRRNAPSWGSPRMSDDNRFVPWNYTFIPKANVGPALVCRAQENPSAC